MWTMILGLFGGNTGDAVKGLAKFAIVAIIVGFIAIRINKVDTQLEEQATTITVLSANNKVLEGKVQGLQDINESNEKIIGLMKANEDFLNDLEKKYEKQIAQEAGKERAKKDAVRLLVIDNKPINTELAKALNALTKEVPNETK